MGQALMEYLLYHEKDAKHALELSAEATTQAEYGNWYWKTMIAKCYYHFGE